MGILIQNGLVVNPAGSESGRLDILCEDGRITRIAPSIPAEQHTVLDAAGRVVAPGFVDMHVHLRDPGLTYKEDIATGTAAAAAPYSAAASITRWIIAGVARGRAPSWIANRGASLSTNE